VAEIVLASASVEAKREEGGGEPEDPWRGNIQGAFQGTFRLCFREHSGNIQGIFKGCFRAH
jgi:hypothetical protein